MRDPERCISYQIRWLLWSCLWLITAAGCATSPPSQPNDICSIFREKPDWYQHAKASTHKWGVPIHVMMAIMHYESGFRSKVKPPRTKCLRIFPGPRPSSAYGYSQAIDGTWKIYRQKTGNSGADRDDFGDAIDFIGWYCAVSHKRCKIPKWHAYKQYLAYHEGQGGYNRGTYRKKSWLMKRAKAVERLAVIYSRQLSQCRAELDRPRERGCLGF